MKKKDKISVALTTFNGEKYLREQLDSLYKQTMTPDEIVVVDDCSNDKTVEILKEYRQEKGLRYYINNMNIGVNKNFEKAIYLCTGDYIAICDQDDVWFSEKIEKLYLKMKEIEKNEIPSLVTSQRIDIDSNGKILKRPKKRPDTDSYTVTLLGHSSQGCSLMMNRKLLEYVLPLPSNLFNMYDIYIGLTAAMIGNKYNISVPLMYYRHHNNNVTGRIESTSIKHLSEIRSVFSKIMLSFSTDRLRNLCFVKEINGHNFIKERRILYDRIIEIIKEPKLMKKFNLIFHCPEIPFLTKVVVAIKVSIDKMKVWKIIFGIIKIKI